MSCGTARHAGGTLSPSSCPTSVYGHRPPQSFALVQSTACGCLRPTVATAYAIRIYEPAEPWGCRDRGQGSEKESVGEAAEAAGQAGGPVTSTELYKFRKWFDGNSALASRTACQRCEIARNAAVWHATCHATRSPEVKMHASRATVYVGCICASPSAAIMPRLSAAAAARQAHRPQWNRTL